MSKEIEIPPEIKYSFQRLMRLTPEHYHQDPEFIKEMLIFLKIGGEKLARKNLEAYLTPFEKEFALRRKTVIEDDTGDSQDTTTTSDKAGAETEDQPGDDGAESAEKKADGPQEATDSAVTPDSETSPEPLAQSDSATSADPAVVSDSAISTDPVDNSESPKESGASDPEKTRED